MNLLLDTCALVWFLRDDPDLPSEIAEKLENPANEAVVSLVSIWEIAIKSSLGKINAPQGLEGPLQSILEESGFRLLPIAYPHAAGVASLPNIHTDPFDRLLISQAKAESLILLTPDSHIRNPVYGIQTMW